MTDSFARLAAIVRADFLIRFRRPSTLVLFLLICFIAYLWVPDPSTGRALLQIGGRRALYNSAAIGMATALIGTMFVGLMGFYVVSNTIGRDLTTRCGSIIASTDVRTSEYLTGKFVGNVAFLTVFLSGFMVSSAVMLLIRAEAPFQIGTFAGQYLLLAPPAIVFVSAMAVLFESIPSLSGRGGDVLYFFLWLAGLGLMATLTALGGTTLPRYLDFSGFAFVIDQFQHGGSEMPTVSIGSSPFDPEKPPMVFEGLRLTPDWAAPRIFSLLSPLALLVVARLRFHRFDPDRVRFGGTRRLATLPSRVAAVFRPLSRLATLAARGSRADSAATQAWVDAIHTLALSPVAVAGLIALIFLSFSPARVFNTAVLIALAVLGVLLADVPCRDARRGTLPLLFSAPRLRENFVPWKALSMAITSMLFMVPALMRTAASRPAGLFPLAVGLSFMVAMSAFLGIASRNPKTFIVLFLSFWYLMLNDQVRNPALDFAGLHGTATPAVTAGYAIVSVGALIAAAALHRWRLRTG